MRRIGSFLIAEVFKYFRSRTLQLEKLKTKIKQEVQNTEDEDKCLEEYRNEMELLLQEKMAHVEELRQIHADINAVILFSFFTFNSTAR